MAQDGILNTVSAEKALPAPRHMQQQDDKAKDG